MENEVARIEKAVKEECNLLMTEFLSRKGWGLFLKLHGFSKNREIGFNKKNEAYFVTFGEEDDMMIEMKGTFADDWTDYFPVSEFAEFMDNDTYYGPEQEKIEAEMAEKVAKNEEARKEQRRKLYEELKKEFDGALKNNKND